MTEVLVAGAGPAGLALAIGLRLRGVEVVVVDRAQGPKHEPRAAVVWPRTAQALAGWGLGPALEAEGLPLAAAHVHIHGRARGTLRFGSLPTPFSRPLVIEQHAVERLLLRRLEALGGRVRWGEALEGVEVEASGAAARLASGPERYRWVVGAEGARSIVRSAMGVRFAGRARPDVVCIQANARPRWRFPDAPGEGRFFLSPGATLGAFRTPDGDHRLYIFARDEDPSRTGPPTLAEMEQRLRRMTDDDGLRLDPPAHSWLNFARFQERTAQRLRVGPLLLVGDSAHVWPAVGGHGMAIGIAGAHRLSGALAHAVLGRGEAGLDTYDRAQRALARRTARLSDLDILERPNGAATLAVLDRVLPALLAVPAIGRGVERVIASLDHPAPASSRTLPTPA